MDNAAFTEIFSADSEGSSSIFGSYKNIVSINQIPGNEHTGHHYATRYNWPVYANWFQNSQSTLLHQSLLQ